MVQGAPFLSGVVTQGHPEVHVVDTPTVPLKVCLGKSYDFEVCEKVFEFRGVTFNVNHHEIDERRHPLVYITDHLVFDS